MTLSAWTISLILILRYIKLGLIYFNLSYRVKSAQEIEEEMLAKIPKFKARPLPKKVLTPEMCSFAAFDDKRSTLT